MLYESLRATTGETPGAAVSGYDGAAAASVTSSGLLQGYTRIVGQGFSLTSGMTLKAIGLYFTNEAAAGGSPATIDIRTSVGGEPIASVSVTNVAGATTSAFNTYELATGVYLSPSTTYYVAWTGVENGFSNTQIGVSANATHIPAGLTTVGDLVYGAGLGSTLAGYKLGFKLHASSGAGEAWRGVGAVLPIRAITAGPPSSTPSNGALAIDSTNNRLYVRVGGTWKYAALT